MYLIVCNNTMWVPPQPEDPNGYPGYNFEYEVVVKFQTKGEVLKWLETKPEKQKIRIFQATELTFAKETVFSIDPIPDYH